MMIDQSLRSDPNNSENQIVNQIVNQLMITASQTLEYNFC